MRILFVDDEVRRMATVVDELRLEGHEVVFQAHVDPALALINDPGEQFDVVVIDVSMPPGRAFQTDDTDGGARTGFHLYDVLRQMRPKIKVIVLTNVADRGVEEHFKNETQSLCRVVRKPSVLPFQFVEEIRKFVAEQR